MSHGKALHRKGEATVEFGKAKKTFSASEKVGLVKGHGDSFSTSKADKAIMNDINYQIAQAWKKDKAMTGDAPEVALKDIEWTVFTAK